MLLDVGQDLQQLQVGQQEKPPEYLSLFLQKLLQRFLQHLETGVVVAHLVQRKPGDVLVTVLLYRRIVTSLLH